MPEKSRQSGKSASIGRTSATNSEFTQRQFIQRELTADEQKACKDWTLFVDRGDDMLAAWLDASGKCSLRFDQRNRTYACWLIPDDGDSGKTGLILSGRGSTPFKAMKQAFFKHHVLFEENWPSEIDARNGIEIDD